MEQPRKPKGSPNGTGGQYDTTGNGAPAPLPDLNGPATTTAPGRTAPIPWPKDGYGTIRDADLNGMDTTDVLNLDWSNITMQHSDMRNTHVTPLDLPYDPDDYNESGPTFLHTLFGDEPHGYTANYTRFGDDDTFATIAMPGSDPRREKDIDRHLDVCDSHDDPIVYSEEGADRQVFSEDDMRREVDEWRHRHNPKPSARYARRLADTLAGYVDVDHGVWRGTDIPANMDTVSPQWLDAYEYRHPVDDDDDDGAR
ncbi:hypothetical protein [Bifidobacterium castoris]|uniref:Uncharacterized protein n=1 Tax=Bifidobacterium castoris TaxID=2306972 RepID=A0A430FAA1_9BIFI|nr:hypothetical protein [Bifidobacterium castoris]RSX49770.1 hypothetical protein D2E22_0231 [Bifidobacterium castoris]